MSVDPLDHELHDIQNELSDALVVHCRLSEEDVRRVRQEMVTAHLTFSEAAVQAGVVTPNELRTTLEWLRSSQTPRDRSVIETALHRRFPARNITLQHAAQVKASSQLILAHDPSNPRSERLRALRTELLLLTDGTPRAKSFAVLSPGAGEGRSQLTAELAIAFAQLGRRTLLVDGDLRHSRQHVLFNAENQWGLAQALAFSTPPQLLSVEGIPHLTVITAGPPAPNPLELLSDGRFEQQVHEWRRLYDTIILDTPPVALYADALAIATLASQVLVVSRARMTAHRDMKEMLRRLGVTQSRILGAVINSF